MTVSNATEPSETLLGTAKYRIGLAAVTPAL
jgi:hypothetical protein